MNIKKQLFLLLSIILFTVFSARLPNTFSLQSHSVEGEDSELNTISSTKIMIFSTIAVVASVLSISLCYICRFRKVTRNTSAAAVPPADREGPNQPLLHTHADEDVPNQPFPHPVQFTLVIDTVSAPAVPMSAPEVPTPAPCPLTAESLSRHAAMSAAGPSSQNISIPHNASRVSLHPEIGAARTRGSVHSEYQLQVRSRRPSVAESEVEGSVDLRHIRSRRSDLPDSEVEGSVDLRHIRSRRSDLPDSEVEGSVRSSVDLSHLPDRTRTSQ